MRRHVVLLAAAFLIAGCSSDQPTAEPSPSITVDEAALTKTVQTMREDMRAPGVVALIRTPEGEVTIADGTTTLGGSTPVTLDDHLRIGSITKTFTTSVILQLIEEGKLALDDPVSQYWQGVPNGDEITIAELLNMRSGLFNYSETVTLNRTLDDDPQKVWDPRELLAIGFGKPVYFLPGEGFHYSNTNTVLLGLIAEEIEGKPLRQIIAERLVEPVGLARTSFPPSDTVAIPDPHPQGYMYGTNVSTIETMALPEAEQQAAAEGTLLPQDVTDENPSWAWAAGQMISTAGDLATWAEALVTGNGVIGQELQQQRIGSVQPAGDSLPAGSAEYGYGIVKYGDIYGHTGELPGFNTFIGHDPVNDVTMVVWSNLGSAADGRAVATEIRKALIEQVYGRPPAS